MRKTILVALTALLMTGVSTTVFADAVAECAKIQGKALGALFSAIFKEGGRACGKGAAMNPLAISHGAVGAASGKFYAKAGKAVDKFGPGSCLVTMANLDEPTINILPEDILSLMQGLANQACLVP